jgi:hypothetical protein
MKLKKQITTVEEVEIEISFPYHVKLSDYLFARVDSEEEYLRVGLYPHSTFIEKGVNSFSVETLISNEPITEDEFTEAYLKAIDLL